MDFAFSMESSSKISSVDLLGASSTSSRRRPRAEPRRPPEPRLARVCTRPEIPRVKYAQNLGELFY